MTGDHLVGTIVTRLADDSPLPLTGRVTERFAGFDEDAVYVAWGDEQFSSSPRLTAEWIDELAPFREQPQADAEAGL